MSQHHTRLLSLALQHGKAEMVEDLLAEVNCVPCGPIIGHDRLKCCSSLSNLIGRLD